MGSNRKVLALSLLGLAVFLAWQAFLLRGFIRTDTRPPSWDQSIHLEIAYDYVQAVHEGRWADIVHLAPKPGMPPFPPLFHLAMTRYYSTIDPARGVLWLNWAYLVVLCVSLFGIAYYFRPDATALAAVLAFVSAPAVQDLYTTQLVDLAVVAISAAAFWALLLAEDFSLWPGSLAFGALYAVGMMHKWSFFAYMFPAYIVAFQNLGVRGRAPKILVAVLVSLAGFMPWYWAHLPVLIPRLFQASSDMAVPVWKGGAFFSYLFNSADGLGPLFWALSWIGLLAPQYRKHINRSWLIPSWIVLSYIFWAVVPNRQMRFLLPALPGLAVALCAGWPDVLIWLTAAVQLFLGFNYVTGRIAPMRIPLPFVNMRIFTSNPPRQEDWKIADILREARSRQKSSRVMDNLTLVANAHYFNGPNFTWTAKDLGFSTIHLRGVNKRLCEFSRFVVLKEGNLGPPGVIGGLPEAVKVINDRPGWFQKAYARVGRWPLPDGSQADLFEQRHLSVPPFKPGAARFTQYDSDAFTARDLGIDPGRWDASAGAYPRAAVKARDLTLRGLHMRDVGLEMFDAALVSAAQPARSPWSEVRLLRMSRLKIASAVISDEDLKFFLEERLRGLSVQKLELNKTIYVEGTFKGVSVAVEASAELVDKPRGLRVTLLALKIGALPVNLGLFEKYRSTLLSLEPNPETPFAVDVPGLTVARGRLTIP